MEFSILFFFAYNKEKSWGVNEDVIIRKNNWNTVKNIFFTVELKIAIPDNLKKQIKDFKDDN